MTTIAISKIVLDETIYSRNGVAEVHIKKLISALRTGVKLPPLIIEARSFRLIDGWHRCEVYKREEIGKVRVEERAYTRLNCSKRLPHR